MISTSSIVHTKSKSTITFGTALSDDRKKIALSHILIERKKLSKDLDEIKIIVENNDVNGIVIGLPLNKDGSKGKQAQSIITFAGNLKKKIEIPLLMWDERFSTAGVKREMTSGGLKKKSIKKNIDCASAAWILQGVLDRLKNDVR